jgi:hypothetical protein
MLNSNKIKLELKKIIQNIYKLLNKNKIKKQEIDSKIYYIIGKKLYNQNI